MSDKELILFAIDKLIMSGSYENFAILTLSKNYYIQLAAAIGDTEMLCEAVSNNYLKGNKQLTPDKIEVLKSLNWEVPANSTENFSCMLPVDSARAKSDLADLIMKTAKAVYGCETIGKRALEINLE